MADLIDRLSGEATDRPKINSHRFVAAQRFYALGVKSRSEIATEFDLQGDEATQATTIADNIDALGTWEAKAQYIFRLEGVCFCVEDHEDTWFHDSGVVDKSAVAALVL